MAPEASGAACWTPPAMGCPPVVEGPSSMPPPYIRPHSLLSLQTMPAPVVPGPSQEPALDLSKPSSSLKSHLPSPASEDGAE